MSIGSRDNPLYELELPAPNNSSQKHLNQFIAHSSLDILEDIQSNATANYLKIIDKFNAFNISAYITPSGVRFLLLHENTNSDSIKSFFVDVHEVYIKVYFNFLGKDLFIY